MANCEMLYRTFSTRTWMACRGVKGSQMAPARMLNMLPKEEDEANLMYLHPSKIPHSPVPPPDVHLTGRVAGAEFVSGDPASADSQPLPPDIASSTQVMKRRIGAQTERART